MLDIRNLDLSLPNLTERLSKISNRLYIMHSSCSFSAREYRVLERMHETIQKGIDGLTQRINNDCSRILVPIKYIQGLCHIDNMKPDELCMLFVEICELIRSQCRSNLSRSSLSFIGGVISGLNRQIRMHKREV